MVLAIGLLVDDAIVVVENVERVMEEEHLSPKEATKRSMEQITGALVGIALVLSAVFVPMAFFGGSGGVIYRQFSITIVSSMILSVLVALIFTPALTSTLLKRPEHGTTQRRGFFGWFNTWFTRSQARYGQQVSRITRRPARALLALLIVAGVAALGYLRLPGGYLPEEDQGFMFVQVTAPPGATDSHVLGVLDDVSHYFLTEEKQAVEGVFMVSGYSFGGHGQTAGLAFVPLKPWEERPGKRNRVQQIAARFNHHFAGTQEAMVFGFPPPAALELGNATGFDFELIDKAGLGHEALMQARNQLLALAAKDPLLARVRANGLDDEPQYRISIDREKASAQGLTLSDINDTIQSAWGSSYVNDFIDRGRLKRVYVQGDAPSRMLPQDLGSWYVRNGTGQMVPFSAFANGEWTYGSPKLERYNGLSSVEILGEPAPRRSTGEAMAEMERLAAKLPHGIGYDWTGLSYEEKQAGSKALFLYALSLAVVFLCLAALYESWAIPAAVLLVIPLGIVGRRAGNVLARTQQRHLLPGGHAHHDGPRGQERDPHRGVRQAESRSGSQSDRCGDGSRAATAAADPHDLLRLHPRRRAARDRLRCGIGRPERHRHGRRGRNDHGHGARDLPGAGVLRRGAAPRRVPAPPPARRPTLPAAAGRRRVSP